MLSFPLNLPAALKFAQITYRARRAHGRNESPFTLSEQIYVHQGQLLELDVVVPPMSGLRNASRNAEDVVAWLLSLGADGTFLLPPPEYTAGARGSLSGSPTVNGNGQSGNTLETDGWTPSAANVLKPGDWFQLGSSSTSRLHKVLQAASANVYGQASLEIFPRLRETPNDGDPLTVVNPKGLFCLSAGTAAETSWSVRAALLYGISFSVREAI